MELLGVYYTAFDAWRVGVGDLMGTFNTLYIIYTIDCQFNFQNNNVPNDDFVYN